MDSEIAKIKVAGESKVFLIKYVDNPDDEDIDSVVPLLPTKICPIEIYKA